MVGTASIPSGGVATPRGFRAAAVSAGIKRSAATADRPDANAAQAEAPLDLALIVSDTPAIAAVVFTTNLAQAAPVVVSREHLRSRAASRGQSSSIVDAPTPVPAMTGCAWHARWQQKQLTWWIARWSTCSSPRPA